MVGAGLVLGSLFVKADEDTALVIVDLLSFSKVLKLYSEKQSVCLTNLDI